MYERFTDGARKSMQLANQISQRFNHEYIGTEHVLIGVLKEDGVAARIVECLGVQPEHIIGDVKKLVQPGPEMVTMGRLPQTPRCKRVIEIAMEEARKMGHSWVGSDHLLLGLIIETEGAASQVLMNRGLRVDTIRTRIREHYRDDHKQPETTFAFGDVDYYTWRCAAAIKEIDTLRAAVERLVLCQKQ
jgi:ATP-dependent Clp protease ATP-binding subunit ClpC